MLKLNTTSQFKKSYKLAKKRGLPMHLLDEVITMLIEEKVLDEKYKDHDLVGNYKGFRECHIKPDWLLLYSIDNNKLTLTLTDTGKHSEVLSKNKIKKQ